MKDKDCYTDPDNCFCPSHKDNKERYCMRCHFEPYEWRYDVEAAAGYLTLSSKAVRKTIPLRENINLDLDEDGSVIGVEIIERKLPPIEEVQLEIQAKYPEVPWFTVNKIINAGVELLSLPIKK